MQYTGIDIKRTLTINKIYSIHYFEYANNFAFEGESHDFWEFICVDKGEVNITAGDEKIELKMDDLFFHEPNEFHSVYTNGVSAPNLVVISFSCNDAIMDFFRHRKFHIDREDRNLLGKIISEARHFFNCRLDDPYMKTIPLKESEIIGAEQLLFFYLEQFLILLLRKHMSPHFTATKYFEKNMKPTKTLTELQLFNNIVSYLKEHVHTQITVEELCKEHSISRSHLQKLFKQRCNAGIIEYFSYLKIQTAKELIRKQSMNFTQISEYLGYSSIHYFSRQFKKITGMTPTEYASSIKSISERRD